MHALYIAATITSVLAFAVIGTHVWLTCDKPMRKWLVLLVILELPMNALAYHEVRLPYRDWLKAALVDHPTLFQWLQCFNAPLTEEPAKLLPFLLVPWLWKKVSNDNLYHVALCVGLGFGVGEAWMLANLLAQVPEYGQYAWYELGGFLQERLMVCVIHSGMSCVALWWALNRRPFWLGLILAMDIHFLGNFPIFAFSPLGLNVPKSISIWLLTFWNLAAFCLMVWLMLKLTNCQRARLPSSSGLTA